MIRDISVKFGHQNENDPEKEQKIDEYWNDTRSFVHPVKVDVHIPTGTEKLLH